MDLIYQWLKGKITEIPQKPELLMINASSVCNHNCLHCYWRHDINQEPSKDWVNKSLKKIKPLIGPDTQILYSGRILNQKGANLIEAIIKKFNKNSGIVENGTIILKFPRLLKKYNYIDISLDGFKKEHNKLRNNKRSFDQTIETLMELKKRNFKPNVCSVISKINLHNFKEFEDYIKNKGFNFCVAPIVKTKVNQIRNKSKNIFLNKKELNQAFDLLINGRKKLINIGSLEQVKQLKDKLKKFRWEPKKNRLVAKLKNGTKIIYRPSSLSYLSELSLLWNGKLVAFDEKSEITSYDKRSLNKANLLLEQELKIWRDILKGGEKSC